MRTLLRYAAFAVLAATLLACDDEQPTQGGSVAAVLTMSTAPSTVPKANVWEVWEDTTFPLDGIPDRPKRVSQPNGPIVHACLPLSETSISVYPWGFSVEVSVLRSGSTQPEIVSTTSGQTLRFTGTTLVPTEDVPVPIPNVDSPPNYLRNGNKLSTANPDYALRCVGLVVDPNIGPGLDNPGTITLNPGDTLIVQARKASESNNPILAGFFLNPALIGTLTVGGQPVSVEGEAQSTEEDGSGISFSYTLN